MTETPQKPLIAVCGALDGDGIVLPEHCFIRTSYYEEDYEEMLENIAHWQPKEPPADPVTPVAFFYQDYTPLPLLLQKRLTPIIARTCFLPMTCNTDCQMEPCSNYTEELVAEVLTKATWDADSGDFMRFGTSGLSAEAESAALFLEEAPIREYADEFAYACLLALFDQTEKEGSILNPNKWDETLRNHD